MATLRALPRLAAPAGRAAAALPPTLKRWLLTALVAAITLAALYMFWFRDSSLVAVHEVEISGLTTSDADRVSKVLTLAAEQMTTLHVNAQELEDSVRGFGVVHALEVDSDFPHKLRIHVIERRAAALVTVNGKRFPVAGDGTVLTGLPVEGRLPVLKGRLSQDGKRVTDAGSQMALHVIRTAPEPLGRYILRVRRTKDRGVVAKLRQGPEVILGTLTNLPAKWAAAASVLADDAAKGATYVDVRLADRPAAGGLGEETIEPTGAEQIQAAAAAAATANGQAAPGTAEPAAPGTTTPTDPQVQPAPGAGAQTPQGAAPQGTQTTPAQPTPEAQTPPSGTEEGGAAPQP